MRDASFSVEVGIGRLIEARVLRLLTREHVDAYQAAVLNVALEMKTTPVLCADHRPASVYPPEAADRLVELFRPNNSRFERIAILVDPRNATLQMQLERLAREAGSEKRRVFRKSEDALTHLAPALNEVELARACRFLEALQ